MTTKRFKLQCGNIIKVDEQDAYLLRGQVWAVNANVVRRPGAGSKSHATVFRADRDLLSHVITNAPNGSVVRYRDGDSMNLTRANLEVVDKAVTAAVGRAHRRLYALLGV